MSKARVGVIGCGTISGIYFQNMTKLSSIEVVACADLVPERAAAVQARYPGVRATTAEELLADPSIDIAVNLTQPGSHYGVMKAGILSGKHVYGEKPLCATSEQAAELLSLADEAGLRVGGAPDTFLGAGIQTCRQLIDDGVIGAPVAATAFMTNHGHESWHPDPAFYYKTGAGPMLDMGPYYLTALVNLMGPAVSVSGSAAITFPERTITSNPLSGTKIAVEVATHVAGTVNFANGAIATVVTTFDVWAANLPRVEIYGTEGSLSVPDPNTYDGPIRVWIQSSGEWVDVPVTKPFSENSRGLGVADMAHGIANDQPHSANGGVAAHVLEIMQAFGCSSDSGTRIDLATTCERPVTLSLPG
ncbi:MAG TPA: Gfo/Idh/MocA family oxidoreductase [Dehalococcoidia bacterium]|jgi:predicted dehydrogenase|nr:oxidoreductase [Chloroflexota bacterium]MDP5877370.1 Gfo/Idh/MocA family oxidoreductase [Dehalococcoidia bacterium]MDP6273362.1 Gfo/Idh/MocA family oxidoreductase [Dehalococcoidia bacterium]MDP7160031.1 Gfo/Idh/MocA family oxidoreductase [Dehalococcoidia bacterium]MDP7212352.1 Gfo/Idh/MocA family oxidoreductase [Dehalococcoidia bacterium]